MKMYIFDWTSEQGMGSKTPINEIKEPLDKSWIKWFDNPISEEREYVAKLLAHDSEEALHELCDLILFEFTEYCDTVPMMLAVLKRIK